MAKKYTNNINPVFYNNYNFKNILVNNQIETGDQMTNNRTYSINWENCNSQ